MNCLEERHDKQDIIWVFQGLLSLDKCEEMSIVIVISRGYAFFSIGKPPEANEFERSTTFGS